MADDLSTRIEELERQVARLEMELRRLSSTPPPAEASSRDGAPLPAPVVRPVWPPPSPPTGRPDRAVARRPLVDVDSEDVLKWGGVVLVVLAVGFAVSTAISRGWIGPEAQLAGAALVSIGLVATGLYLRRSRPG